MKKCKNNPKRTYTGSEPSPKGFGWCASSEKIATIRIGKDKNEWIIKKISNGSKRWVLHNYPDNKINKIKDHLYDNFKVWWQVIAGGNLIIVNKNKKYRIVESKKKTVNAQLNEIEKFHYSIVNDKDIEAIIWSAQSVDSIEGFITYILTTQPVSTIEKLLGKQALDTIILNYKKLFKKYNLRSSKDYTFKYKDTMNDNRVFNKLKKSKKISKIMNK